MQCCGAFRQSSAAETASVLRSVPQPLAFRLSRFFGWRSYAAAAAALAICIGLGLWFLQGSGTTAHRLRSRRRQPSSLRSAQR